MIVDGFPSVGLVSTIAANYLIDSLELKQIGVMEHPDFPSLSVVHNGEPLAPVRIYGGQRKGKGNGKGEPIVVFVSEFQPAQQLVRPIARAILEWGRRKKCKVVVSPEGLVLEGEGEDGDDVEVYGVGSGKVSQALIKEARIRPFKEGIITGVSGVLLNVGKRESFEVVSLLAEAHPNYPDARSAARVIEVFARLLHLELDVGPLLREAEGFEAQIKALHKQAGAKAARQESASSMYG